MGDVKLLAEYSHYDQFYASLLSFVLGRSNVHFMKPGLIHQSHKLKKHWSLLDKRSFCTDKVVFVGGGVVSEDVHPYYSIILLNFIQTKVDCVEGGLSRNVVFQRGPLYFHVLAPRQLTVF